LAPDLWDRREAGDGSVDALLGRAAVFASATRIRDGAGVPEGGNEACERGHASHGTRRP
jgi:hypothetical protein